MTADRRQSDFVVRQTAATLLIAAGLVFPHEIILARRSRPLTLRVIPEAADLAAQSAAEHYRKMGLAGVLPRGAHLSPE